MGKAGRAAAWTGVRASVRELALWSRPGVAGRPSRLSLAVSRRLGTAVARNRTKRLLREAFREMRARVAEGSDLLVMPRPGPYWKDLEGAADALTRLLKRAGFLRSPDSSL